MACDLQDPPELIEEFVRLWRSGFKVVIGVKPQSREASLMFLIRRWYYRTLNTISETPLIENFTGFGLYDREVVETLRRIPDRRPYLRGLIAELGYIRAEVPFIQPRRERGVTSNNFYSLYDLAMTGVTSHSRVPLRLATMAGFLLGCCSLAVALIYLIAKLVFWNDFAMGQAPVLIGVFFFGSVQLFFVGSSANTSERSTRSCIRVPGSSNANASISRNRPMMELDRAWWRLPQQVRFVVAGGFNTAAGYLLFSGLYLLLGQWVHYLLIGLAAHMIAVVIAFNVHRKFVFRSTDAWWPAFVRFNLSQLVSLAFGMSALFGLVEFVRWSPLLAQFVVTLVSVVLNYLLHRHFSFRKRVGSDMGGA